MAGMNIDPSVWQAKYGGGTQAYAGAPVQSLMQGLATPEETQAAYDANGNGATGGGPRSFYRSNGFDIVPLPGGHYAVMQAGVPGMGAEQHNGKPYDIYDASGKYVGTKTWEGLGSKVADFWDKAVPIATMAMIGGGIAGGFGVGPFAGGSGAGSAGAAGAGFAGDATAAGYAGLDAASAASLGGGASIPFGGAGAAGVAGAGAAAAGASGGAAGGAGGLASLFGGGAGASGLGGWASLISPALSAVGGWMQSNAAEDAANAQMGAAREGIAEQRRQFDKVLELLGPYLEGGKAGMAGYRALAGVDGAQAQQAAIQQLQDSPQFGSLVQQGEDAILQNASATGGLRGGNVQNGLAKFRSNLLTNLIDQQLGRYDRLTTFGQNSAAGAGSAAMTTGTNNANLLQQAGAAQAGGIVAGSNAITNALGGIGGFFAGQAQPAGTAPTYAARAF